MYNLFVLLPNLSDKEIEVIQAQIKEIIKKVDGKIEKIEEVGKRKLSYAVKNVRHGFYADYMLSLPKEKIDKLTKELKINPGILRFELVKAENHRTSPRYSSGPKYRTTSQYKEARQVWKVKKDKQEMKNIKEKKERPRISMEELDKKLNNILDVGEV